MIKRIYTEEDENYREDLPFRYRLRLYKDEDGELVMEYMKFRTGFWDYEECDNVVSNHKQSSYLWGKEQNPSWNEMSKKEEVIKEEFIRYMEEGIDQLETEIEYHTNRVNSLKSTIEKVTMSKIRKHSFLV